MTDKVENLLLRLPLELRQRIYATVLGPPRLVLRLNFSFELDDFLRAMIYRPKSEKLRESEGLAKFYNEIDGESEEGFSESDKENAHRFSDDVIHEALDVLYGQHIFVTNIHGEGHLRIREVGVANLHRIRYLRIVARPMGVSYGRPLVFDPELWLPLLEGLSQFCIVAQQPLAARGYYDAPTLEEDLSEWTTWLDPILGFFRATIPNSTAVGLDADAVRRRRR
ncbi:hypothetical protein CLAIMM_02376 [Cladophialophora immunda]|nr:hypothetical protein CLAIMM_02376 [Cladophialophora immunda]